MVYGHQSARSSPGKNIGSNGISGYAANYLPVLRRENFGSGIFRYGVGSRQHPIAIKSELRDLFDKWGQSKNCFSYLPISNGIKANFTLTPFIFWNLIPALAPQDTPSPEAVAEFLRLVQHPESQLLCRDRLP